MMLLRSNDNSRSSSPRPSSCPCCRVDANNVVVSEATDTVPAAAAPPPQRNRWEDEESINGNGNSNINVNELVVKFDNQSSPCHTVVHIISPDRRGLLFHLCNAFGMAHCALHSSRGEAILDSSSSSSSSSAATANNNSNSSPTNITTGNTNYANGFFTPTPAARLPRAQFQFCITENTAGFTQGMKITTPQRQQDIRRSLSSAITDDRALSITVLASYTAIEVTGADRPGLLGDLARGISSCGLNVHFAKISTINAWASDVFWVKKNSGQPVEERTYEAIRRAVKESLDDPAGTVAVRRPDAELFDVLDPERQIELEDEDLMEGAAIDSCVADAEEIPARIDVDNAADAKATAVSVTCEDRTGLLFDLSRAVSSCGVSMKRVRITTAADDESLATGEWGGKTVLGTFYVVDSKGAKITDATMIDALRKAITATCSTSAVLLDANNNSNLTLMQIGGRDQPGILQAVMALLRQHHISITHAKISTHGGWFNIMFYFEVTNQDIHEVSASVQSLIREKARSATPATSTRSAPSISE